MLNWKQFPWHGSGREWIKENLKTLLQSGRKKHKKGTNFFWLTGNLKKFFFYFFASYKGASREKNRFCAIRSDCLVSQQTNVYVSAVE